MYLPVNPSSVTSVAADDGWLFWLASPATRPSTDGSIGGSRSVPAE
jgi:hypothetical protein